VRKRTTASALAERYAPVVRLVSQDEPCAHGEAYQPTDVNLVLGNPAIATTYLYFDLRVAKQHEAEAAEASEVLPFESPPAVAPQ
jgi:hypothetical protein